MKSLSLYLPAVLFWSASTFAQDFQFVGKIEQPVRPEVQKTIQAQAMRHAPQAKEIKLPPVTVLKVQLSEHAWSKLQEKADTNLGATPQNRGTVMQGLKQQSSVQLGMNDLPVFDQGPHGSCVTFAISAAISAALDRGDYVSELCQLQLGRYLEKNGYMPSGWDGAFASVVLNQMESFGIVSKKVQYEQGCGGYTSYPTNTLEEPAGSLSLEDYHLISESFPDDLGWSVVLDQYQVFSDKVSPQATLERVKAALQAGDRLVFGVMLFRIDEGVAGAVGRYQAPNDTWVLTPEIIAAIYAKDTEVGGHEMVITGYDDYATAVDAKGRVHKGLLTLRNSWGSAYGNEGTFYMSYDYFKALTLDIQRIRKF